MEKDQAKVQEKAQAGSLYGGVAQDGFNYRGFDYKYQGVATPELAKAWSGPQKVARAGEQAHVIRGLEEGACRMNVFDKLSHWWENRKPVKRSEFDLLKSNTMKIIEEERKTSVALKVSELLIRMDRLELYVGLKREQRAVPVDGTARIS